MEVIGDADDLGLVGLDAFHLVAPLARGFKGGLHRLGAGVHRKDHLVAAELAQLFEERAYLVVVESARGQRDLPGLGEQGLENAGVPVAVVQR